MSAAGIPYLWHGGHMGTIDGNVNQDEAIDWVAQLVRDNRLVIMCSDAAPQNCNLRTMPACSWRTGWTSYTLNTTATAPEPMPNRVGQLEGDDADRFPQMSRPEHSRGNRDRAGDGHSSGTGGRIGAQRGPSDGDLGRFRLAGPPFARPSTTCCRRSLTNNPKS